MKRVLLTVSGVIPEDIAEQVAQGRRPRPDYCELAAALDADLLDVAEARKRAGRLGRIIERIGGVGGLLAWVAARDQARYQTIVTDGEHVGLPLAALLRLRRRRARHAMIVHVLSAPKKVRLYRTLRLGGRIDAMLVYSSWQQRFISDSMHYPPEQIALVPFMVDTEFFAPARVAAADRPRPMLCSAGLERRDYPTLIEAVKDLDIDVVVAAASPWSKQADSTDGAAIPANVEVCRLGFVDLRQLYADADLVVMPLQEVDFQAGVTTILEAMAMAKPIICSKTLGQTDTITDGVDGVYVRPADAQALRSTITELLAQPGRCEELGRAARATATRRHEVTTYALAVADAVIAVLRTSEGV